MARRGSRSSRQKEKGMSFTRVPIATGITTVIDPVAKQRVEAESSREERQRKAREDKEQERRANRDARRRERREQINDRQRKQQQTRQELRKPATAIVANPVRKVEAEIVRHTPRIRFVNASDILERVKNSQSVRIVIVDSCPQVIHTTAVSKDASCELSVSKDGSNNTSDTENSATGHEASPATDVITVKDDFKKLVESVVGQSDR